MSTFHVIRNKKLTKEVINFFTNYKIFILPVLFFLVYIILYFLIDPSTQSLIAHDEGLYARRARLIENSDNWFSPPFNTPHHKTLGSYWLIALAIKFFGNSELALRLPSVFTSFLCLIISYLIALKVSNKKSALISLFALSSMPLWIQYSRYASPDIPFVFFILLFILLFLKSIDSSKNIQNYFYIFFSGIFLSISFYVRSYMAFVPLIGLSPFILYHLFRKDNLFKLHFINGVLLGSLPTFLNLYYSFRKFGFSGITKLFDFARKQAIGDFGFIDLLFVPLKFAYLTFPVGILFLILFVFTKSNIKTKYPLLTYCYPLISLSLLLCMSTSYPHYYLFLLPPLSILFSVFITSNSYRFSFSKLSIKSFLIVIILVILSILLFSVVNYVEYINFYSYRNKLLLFIILLLLFLSYIISIRFLIDFKKFQFDLIKFFYNVFIPQYISLSLLFNFGILGNPNRNIKLFLNNESVSSVIHSNTVYLIGVDSKIQTLLSYYLPSSKIVDDFNEISKYKYVITADRYFLEKSVINKGFNSINKFDNHIFLVNLTK